MPVLQYEVKLKLEPPPPPAAPIIPATASKTPIAQPAQANPSVPHQAASPREQLPPPPLLAKPPTSDPASELDMLWSSTGSNLMNAEMALDQNFSKPKPLKLPYTTRQKTPNETKKQRTQNQTNPPWPPSLPSFPLFLFIFRARRHPCRSAQTSVEVVPPRPASSVLDDSHVAPRRLASAAASMAGGAVRGSIHGGGVHGGGVHGGRCYRRWRYPGRTTVHVGSASSSGSGGIPATGGVHRSAPMEEYLLCVLLLNIVEQCHMP
ncbi:hypothetical protein PR202_gb19908 [Eleusine coracana subsp. coracana]|uniref:Uncharacterized protein n=1 Tax=Eleusine coracana subsp. coracana TaxID=191504 RepID=A0AAV5FB28_ELECO|nr:hypothetical protein PR202_gb19908 [Eleusine coracana subsp. coracana]